MIIEFLEDIYPDAVSGEFEDKYIGIIKVLKGAKASIERPCLSKINELVAEGAIQIVGRT